MFVSLTKFGERLCIRGFAITNAVMLRAYVVKTGDPEDSVEKTLDFASRSD
jgi:hypothetical protein